MTDSDCAPGREGSQAGGWGELRHSNNVIVIRSKAGKPLPLCPVACLSLPLLEIAIRSKAGKPPPLCPVACPLSSVDNGSNDSNGGNHSNDGKDRPGVVAGVGSRADLRVGGTVYFPFASRCSASIPVFLPTAKGYYPRELLFQLKQKLAGLVGGYHDLYKELRCQLAAKLAGLVGGKGGNRWAWPLRNFRSGGRDSHKTVKNVSIDLGISQVTGPPCVLRGVCLPYPIDNLCYPRELLRLFGLTAARLRSWPRGRSPGRQRWQRLQLATRFAPLRG